MVILDTYTYTDIHTDISFTLSRFRFLATLFTIYVQTGLCATHIHIYIYIYIQCCARPGTPGSCNVGARAFHMRSTVIPADRVRTINLTMRIKTFNTVERERPAAAVVVFGQWGNVLKKKRKKSVYVYITYNYIIIYYTYLF